MDDPCSFGRVEEGDVHEELGVASAQLEPLYLLLLLLLAVHLRRGWVFGRRAEGEAEDHSVALGASEGGPHLERLVGALLPDLGEEELLGKNFVVVWEEEGLEEIPLVVGPPSVVDDRVNRIHQNDHPGARLDDVFPLVARRRGLRRPPHRRIRSSGPSGRAPRPSRS